MTVDREPALRIGARVLLLNRDDEVLLVHARDPTTPATTGRNSPAAARTSTRSSRTRRRREITEETGLALDEPGRELLTRESLFAYRGRERHRLERRWWSATDLADCRDKLLPAKLPEALSVGVLANSPTRMCSWLRAGAALEVEVQPYVTMMTSFRRLVGRH